MEFSEKLRSRSALVRPELIDGLESLNLDLHTRAMNGVEKAKEIRRRADREMALKEVRRLSIFGLIVRAPREHLFVIASSNNAFPVTQPNGSSYHELGYSITPKIVSEENRQRTFSFISDHICTNPSASQDPGAPYAYSPYAPYMRVRLAGPGLLVDLIHEDEIPENVVNPAPPKDQWNRYINIWSDCGG